MDRRDAPGRGKTGAEPVATGVLSVGALFPGVSWGKRWHTRHHANPRGWRFREKRWERGSSVAVTWAILRLRSRDGRSRDAGAKEVSRQVRDMGRRRA